ncbi:MAG: VCBS repeat-containing protein, partial [Candidatus Brocadiaceae bacterium]
MSQQDDGCYLPVIGSAWRLALADVNGDGARELIYGAYDGAVRCQDLATGDLLWEVATDSFPFGLAAGDADGDGRPEVYAVTADGGLFAIGSGGEPGWTFRSHFPLYDVEVGRLEGEERMQVVCGGIDRKVRVLSPAGELVAEREVERLVLRLALADLDNDGLQEILALDGHDRLLALKLASGRLRTLWTKHMRVPADRRTWHNPALTFSALTLETGDVNGDGSPEILLGSSCHNDHQVLALTAEGDDMWLSAPQRWEFRGETYTEFYSCAMPRVIGGLRGRPGARVLVVTGGSVKVLDASGEILQEANARVGFTDVALDGCTVYLGSSPNGDDAVYRVDLEQDWAGAVEALRRRGVALRVGENLAALREQVLAYEDTPPEGHGPYVIRDLRLRPNERSRRRYESYLAWHR